jgi:hypothetical protein
VILEIRGDVFMVIHPQPRVVDHLLAVSSALIAQNLRLKIHKGLRIEALLRMPFHKIPGKDITGAVQERILHCVIHIVLVSLLLRGLFVHKA